MVTPMIQVSQDISTIIPSARKERLQKAKDLIKQFAKPNVSVVDALIAERREAALHE